MILIFDTEQEAMERSMVEAFRRGCYIPKTKFFWSINFDEKSQKWYLDVGDGEGLTHEELNRCIELELENGTE